MQIEGFALGFHNQKKFLRSFLRNPLFENKQRSLDQHMQFVLFLCSF